MAMEPNLAASMQPMYDPRRVITHPKPDSTVPSPPGSENKVEAANDSTLADLASSEISLDLQGLIDDAHFGADAENLFGDLMDHNGGNGSHGGQHHGGPGKRDYVRLSPVNSLGSSANSSPGDHHHHQDSPPSFSNYRSSLAYLPGSVHGASHGLPGPNVSQGNQNQNNSLPSITTLGNAVFVKQEPSENDVKRQQQLMQHQQQTSQNNASQYVSSTTMAYNMGPGSGPSGPAGPVPRAQMGPKNFKGYPNPPSSQSSTSSSSSGSKKKVDRNSDEYRRRRERNNVAVRKSREKAKMRSRETEDRVKILARENERLQKKVELLQEELAVLRSLFSNVGVLPDHIHRELSKHIDNFQQQHNAMACM